jgi:hypothetical protein
MRTDTDTIEQRTSKVHDLLLPPVTAPTKQFDNVSVVDYLPSAGMSHISLPFRNLQTLRVPPDVSHMWTPVFIPEYHALTRGHEVVRFNTPRAQAGYRMPKSEGKLTLHVPVCPVRWSYSLPFDAPAVDLVFHPAAVDYSRGNARMYLSYLIQIGIFVGLVTKQKGQVRVAGLEAAPSVYGQTAHSVVLKRTPLHLRDGVTFMTLENWRSHVDPVVYEPMEIMAEEEVITSAPPRMSIKYQFGDMN